MDLENKLKKLVQEVEEDLNSVSIPYKSNLPFIINSRMVQTLGKCCYHSNNGKKEAYKVEISKVYLKSVDDQQIKNTIAHELLHSIDECVYDHHGSIWKSFANKVNTELPQYNITRLHKSTSEELDKMYRYKIVCKNCGEKSYYKSKCHTVKIVEQGKPYLQCECGCREFELIDNKKH